MTKLQALSLVIGTESLTPMEFKGLHLQVCPYNSVSSRYLISLKFNFFAMFRIDCLEFSFIIFLIYTFAAGVVSDDGRPAIFPFEIPFFWNCYTTLVKRWAWYKVAFLPFMPYFMRNFLFNVAGDYSFPYSKSIQIFCPSVNIWFVEIGNNFTIKLLKTI